VVDYLNQDHPVFRQFPARRLHAVREVLKQSLEVGHALRIQFDRGRLQRVIGVARLSRLMPNLPQQAGGGEASAYDVFAGPIDAANKQILQQILDPAPADFPERPLNSIRSFRVLDKNQRTLLRSGDRNAFMLFALPDPQRSALLQALQNHAIPADVIEQVDVDLERLEP
jgi:hypothetical protein